MAYIRRVQIDNHRSIKQLDIALAQPGDSSGSFRHLILTGTNGAGKSSALELIHVALPKLDRAAQSNIACRVELDGTPDRRDEQLVTFFSPQRLLQTHSVAGPLKIDWLQVLRGETVAAAKTTQFLVNRKIELAFARDDGDTAAVAAIEAWLAELCGHLAEILEDPGLALHFDRKNFTVLLRHGDGRLVSFDQLGQGHSAALSVYFELAILRHAHREVLEIPLGRLHGIVFIDEIEAHLHPRLQALILPLLTRVFPGFQFLVTTHSPAVVASLPDAVVHDLG